MLPQRRNFILTFSLQFRRIILKLAVGDKRAESLFWLVFVKKMYNGKQILKVTYGIDGFIEMMRVIMVKHMR